MIGNKGIHDDSRFYKNANPVVVSQLLTHNQPEYLQRAIADALLSEKDE